MEYPESDGGVAGVGACVTVTSAEEIPGGYLESPTQCLGTGIDWVHILFLLLME